MTLKEAYEGLGGDYDEVLSRLPSERLVKKFALKFLEDDNYGKLEAAMAGGDRESAFRAAHTIKGVCQNLAFNRLGASVSVLTEALRESWPENAGDLFASVKEDYEATKAVLSQFAKETVS